MLIHMADKVQRFYTCEGRSESPGCASGIFVRNRFYHLEIERLRSRKFIAEKFSNGNRSLHSAPHYHLALFTDGGGSWLDNRGMHKAEEHDLLLLPPFYPHMILTCRPETYRIIILTFRYNDCGEFAKLPFHKLLECYTGRKTAKFPVSASLSPAESDRLEEHFETMLDNLLSFEPCRDMAVIDDFNRIIEFLHRLNHGFSRSGGTIDVHVKVRKIKEHINRSPERNIPLEELALKAGISKEHLIRTFREMYGIPPVRYRMERRMDKAVSLLMNTNMKIREIAESTGFRNIFYFSRMFKKLFGLSPKEFREQNNRD